MGLLTAIACQSILKSLTSSVTASSSGMLPWSLLTPTNLVSSVGSCHFWKPCRLLILLSWLYRTGISALYCLGSYLPLRVILQQGMVRTSVPSHSQSSPPSSSHYPPPYLVQSSTSADTCSICHSCQTTGQSYSHLAWVRDWWLLMIDHDGWLANLHWPFLIISRFNLYNKKKKIRILLVWVCSTCLLVDSCHLMSRQCPTHRCESECSGTPCLFHQLKKKHFSLFPFSSL